jgi:hypothetical protein
LNIFASNVTTSKCVVELGVIEALHSIQTPVVAGSTLQVGSTVLQLPALAVGQYIECTDLTSPSTSCRVFDTHGEQLKERVDVQTDTVQGAIADDDGNEAGRLIHVAMSLLPPHLARTSIIVTERSAERIGPFQLGPQQDNKFNKQD